MADSDQENEGRTFSDIPYRWSGSATDDEIHQVYEHLKRERFWITETYDSGKNHAGKNPGLTLRMPEGRFANVELDGYVFMVFAILDSVSVNRFTKEEWESLPKA
jgi:hypothetical protein